MINREYAHLGSILTLLSFHTYELTNSSDLSLTSAESS